MKHVKNMDWDNKLFFILGPCAIESESHSLKIAEFLKKLSEKLKFNFIFKASFDKANRSSLKSPRGVGIDQGLKILNKISEQFQVPVTSDVHEVWQVEQVGAVVDVIQIPAFLCRQTDLVVAAGKTGKVVNIKKGQFIAAENMGNLVKKVESTGNEKVWLTERGYAFGYNNLIVDFRNFPIMKNFKKPIIFDATHSVQRPGGLGATTGGNREFITNLASAAVCQNIAGIFAEVHDNPEKAFSDGPNSIRLSQLESFLDYLIDLDAWVKSRQMPEMS